MAQIWLRKGRPKITAVSCPASRSDHLPHPVTDRVLLELWGVLQRNVSTPCGRTGRHAIRPEGCFKVSQQAWNPCLPSSIIAPFACPCGFGIHECHVPIAPGVRWDGLDVPLGLPAVPYRKFCLAVASSTTVAGRSSGIRRREALNLCSAPSWRSRPTWTGSIPHRSRSCPRNRKTLAVER